MLSRCSSNLVKNYFSRKPNWFISQSASIKSRKFSTGSLPKALHKLGKLNHVAIATNDLPGMVSFYRDILGAKVSKEQDLADHGVTTVFVQLGGTNIELLKPFGENSPIANFLTKNPRGGMHHICLEVDDIHKAVSSVRAAGVKTIEAEPKTGAHGNPVIFLHPKDCGGVLVELEQIVHEIKL